MPTNVCAYKATIIHSIGFGQLEILQPGLLGVDCTKGSIVFLYDLKNQSENDFCHLYDQIIDFGDQMLIPGFVDGHAHAPQHSFVGIGMHLPLLEWLDTYTFEEESKFSNVEYARQVYTACVQRHLLNGTTTCSYFATIHLEASKILADIVQNYGQRGFIGKVNMDRNSPDFLIEKTENSIQDTRNFIDYVLSKKDPLLTPVITPRFAPSTTSILMEELGRISREHNPPLPVQSHLSENSSEIEWVKNMHPDCDSYTSVYDRHGLLHDRTYMAHCIWCNQNERQLLVERGTAVIHCPNSNFSLSSGILNVRRMINEGIKVGLGTDVAGGYSTSMLDAIRQTVTASKLVAAGNGSCGDGLGHRESFFPLTYAEAFHLATVGGAECLGLGDEIGNFLVGKQMDALVIDVAAQGSPFDQHTHDSSCLNNFQKFLFLGDDRNIVQVMVNGKIVNKKTKTDEQSFSFNKNVKQ